MHLVVKRLNNDTALMPGSPQCGALANCQGSSAPQLSAISPLSSLLHGWHPFCPQDAHVPALDDLTHTNLEGQGASTLIGAVKHTTIAGQAPGVMAPRATQHSNAHSTGQQVSGRKLCPPVIAWYCCCESRNVGTSTTKTLVTQSHRCKKIPVGLVCRTLVPATAAGGAWQTAVCCRHMPLSLEYCYVHCYNQAPPDECSLDRFRSIPLLDVTELQTTGGASQLTAGCSNSRLCRQADSGCSSGAQKGY